MPHQIFAKSRGIPLILLGVVLAAQPAYAGFEWVAPSSNNSYQQQPSVVVAPPPARAVVTSATSAPEIISPVIITGNSASVYSPSPAAPVNSMPPVTISSAPAVQEPAKANFATETISVAAPSNEKAKEGIVEGFASQVPLPLALRQILPIGYSFSIDPAVSVGTLVSYRGGRPWRETLKDMLANAGLFAREQGTQVSVGAVATPVITAQAPPPSLAIAPAPAPPSTMHYLTPPASSEVAAVPAITVNPADGWTAQRGDTLHKVLSDWCHKNNVELQWLAEYDYPVEASTHFSSSFEDAVRNLLAGFDGARPQPIGELHTNANAGQMVLVIQTRGNSYN